jgi:hypothetical protein
LDLDFSSNYKDWKVSHQQKYFSKTYGVSIGEQFSLLKSGETYFKVKASDYSDETKTGNSKTFSFSVDQYFSLREGQNLLITTLDISQLGYSVNKTLNSDTYLVRVVYLFFEIIPTYTLQTVFSASVTDTKKQRPVKGHEVNLSPSIELAKTITDKIRLALNYNFTKNSSKQETSSYKKHLLGLELGYTF